MRRTVLLSAAAPLILSLPLSAQPLSESRAGPVIDDFGPVYPVDAPDFATPVGEEYRVVFEVAQGAGDPSEVNPRIETLARFLNMHAQAGVDPRKMHLALVLHGSAGKEALNDAGYRERLGMENPNLPLLEALAEAGVQIVLCGQTQQHRGLPRERLAEPVRVALSAMTALLSYQRRGYGLIVF